LCARPSDGCDRFRCADSKEENRLMLKEQIPRQGCLHRTSIQLKAPTPAICPQRTCPVTVSRATEPLRGYEPKICKQILHRVPPRTKLWTCCEPLPYKSSLRHESLDLAGPLLRYQ